MSPLLLAPCPMNQLVDMAASRAVEWLWEGSVARGHITLLTGKWKGGKTTLVAGLLRALAGGTFLDRPCAAASAVILSEESTALWIERRRAIPIGPHVGLVSRPFAGRPTFEQWDILVGEFEGLQAAGRLDLLVVDSLAAFLPGRCESDPATLQGMFQPLRRLAASGAGVMVLHHPRKKRADAGHTARGGQAQLECADIVLELSRVGQEASDTCRRRITGWSSFPETPESLCYEWAPGTDQFRTAPDVLTKRYRENLELVRTILARRVGPATHRELRADWPPGRAAPSIGHLYEWLSRAMAEKLVVRTGAGNKADPYRFRLNALGDADARTNLESSAQPR